MFAAPCVGPHGGIINLCAIFAVCACRAGVAFRPLWPSVTFFALQPLRTLRAALALNATRTLFTTRTSLALRASGTRSTRGALRALLTLRTSRADGARIAFVSFVALKVAVGDAVFERFQAVSGLKALCPAFLADAPACSAAVCASVLACSAAVASV